MREMTKDVKTGFLTQPVIGLLKPVIYRLPDYMTSHVTWLIIGCRLYVNIWGVLHSNTGRGRLHQLRLWLVERRDRSWIWRPVEHLQRGPVFTKCVWDWTSNVTYSCMREKWRWGGRARHAAQYCLDCTKWPLPASINFLRAWTATMGTSSYPGIATCGEIIPCLLLVVEQWPKRQDINSTFWNICA